LRPEEAFAWHIVPLKCMFSTFVDGHLMEKVSLLGTFMSILPFNPMTALADAKGQPV
jgi:hypothetical protein